MRASVTLSNSRKTTPSYSVNTKIGAFLGGERKTNGCQSPRQLVCKVLYLLSRSSQKRPSPAPGPLPMPASRPHGLSSLLLPARIMGCFPWHTPLSLSPQARVLQKEACLPGHSPACTRHVSRWGLVCPLGQQVTTKHLLGAGEGQASGPRGQRGDTGVWWLRRGLCNMLAEFQTQLLTMRRRGRNDNFHLSTGSFPSARAVPCHQPPSKAIVSRIPRLPYTSAHSSFLSAP